MNGTLDVLAALQARLVSSTGANVSSSNVAWPGKEFIPGTTNWYRVTFTPTEQPVLAAVANASPVRYVGVFQIDVFYPKQNYGDGTIRTEAERIVTFYKTGTIIIYNGKQIYIDSASAGKTDEEETWLHVPIKIWWRADI